MAYRLALPAAALGVFAALAALLIFGAPALYFGSLGFMAADPHWPPFIDMHSILAAAQCHRLGFDVAVANPCDVLQRTFSYSPLWFLITPPWGPEATIPAGMMLDISFILSWSLIIRPRTRGELALFALATFSPTVIFALERANGDLIMFLLVLAAAAFYLAPRGERLCSYAILLLAGLLKYYPVVLLAFMAREHRRVVLLPASFCLTGLVFFVAYYHAELSEMLAVIPTASSFGNAFSARNLPAGIADLVPPDFVIRPSLIRDLVFGAFLLLALRRLKDNIRRLARVDVPTDARLTCLSAMGGLVLTTCFFAGQNLDYRGVFFLLVLPGLVRWRRTIDDTVLKRWLGRLIAAIVFLMWREFFRQHLMIELNAHAPEWVRTRLELFFWLARELVWWWTIAGLAAITFLYLWRLPLVRESVASMRRLTPFAPRPS